MSLRQFSSYEDAKSQLNLNFNPNNELNGTRNYGIESINFKTGPDSYNYAKRDCKLLYVVGVGQKSGPGHPSNHQSELNQGMVIKACSNNQKIHVIHEVKPGLIVYFGIYRIIGMNRKITEAGWVYSQIELRRD